jgi:quercetin dioxygenase-like cupin family protein
MKDIDQTGYNVQSIDKRTPFVMTLPRDGVRYFEILKPPPSVTMRSGLVTLDVGEDVGSHTTGKNEEILVILDGQGWVESEGLGERSVASGQIAYIPPDTRHNVFNRSDRPLRYIFIVARAE